MKSQQSGFTLIELVVVILILSVLAATALPRFMDVNEKAHHAAVAGAAGGLGSAVSLVKAQWVANGETGVVDNLAGFGDDTIDVSVDGWPQSTNGDNTADSSGDCIQIWNGVMQNPPPVATDTSGDYQVSNRTAGSDFICRYTYQPSSTPARFIEFNTNSGAVTSVNPKP